VRLLVTLLVLLPACSSTENPSPPKTAVSESVAQQPQPQQAQPATPPPAAPQAPPVPQGEPNPAAQLAVRVLDSLLSVPAPVSLTVAERRTWSEQTTWLKSLKDRIRNLLSMVVAPATVPTPAPIDQKNVLALQQEAEQESLKFDLSSPPLRARHEAAMNALRKMK
jgi:hypothetical protein